jgi:hypothetical protein
VFDPGILAPSTTYYWAVDERDGSESLFAAGLVWSFSTLNSPPSASQPDPADSAT